MTLIGYDWSISFLMMSFQFMLFHVCKCFQVSFYIYIYLYLVVEGGFRDKDKHVVTELGFLFSQGTYEKNWMPGKCLYSQSTECFQAGNSKTSNGELWWGISSKNLSVLMLCTPTYIFTSRSSALLGCPHCGLSIWLTGTTCCITLF